MKQLLLEKYLTIISKSTIVSRFWTCITWVRLSYVNVYLCILPKTYV